jgi:large subunit ribosomal protein L21
VDRLPAEQGAQIDVARVLLMADGDTVMVGTPAVSDILVKATIVEHFRGPKVFRFKYSPKKRIRVRGGHRQQYTRLMVDFIGRAGEERKVEAKKAPKAAKQAEVKEEALVDASAKPKAVKKSTATKAKVEKKSSASTKKAK